MSKERKISRLNEILLDATGFNKIQSKEDLREFLFRLIIMYPEINFSKNLKTGGYLFVFNDMKEDEYKYTVVDLLTLKNHDSFRNEINHELFISDIDSYRSVSNAAQMFGGVSMLDDNFRMLILNNGKVKPPSDSFTDVYNIAADIINLGEGFMGNQFQFDS